MKLMTKLFATSACALALSACDFEQRPDSAPDQGGSSMTQPRSPGAAPMSPGGAGGAGGGTTSPGGTSSGGAAGGAN
ncbi:MAG: hypothetical protein GX652_14025 [Burkholderiaceae bacterium]|nr:hypothetical protein [Burkholderiaceae bacterium]